MVNALPSPELMPPCETFEIYLEGEDPSGMRKQFTHTWETADTMKRLALIQVILVLKLVQWMQEAFNERGINYTLVVWPAAA